MFASFCAASVLLGIALEQDAMNTGAPGLELERALQFASTDKGILGQGIDDSLAAKIPECLGVWIKKYRVSTILNIGCGDGDWQRLIPGIEKVSYYGFDTSPRAIRLAKSRNRNSSNMHFGILDFVSGAPSIKAWKADMVVVNDIIIYLPLTVGLQILENAKSVGIKWLAVTTHPQGFNAETELGLFYPNNVQARPFKFGKEVERCIHASVFDLRLFDLQSWCSSVDVHTQQVFEWIFETNAWGSKETRSGYESEVSLTAKVRECLGRWIEKYKVSTLLDIPCGDGNWQKLIPGVDNVSYYGYDISLGAIRLARSKNRNKTNMRFGVLDLVSCVPPIKADMIIVKDAIQHLQLNMGVKMLQNAKHAGIKWLAVSTHPQGWNAEIDTGLFYPNNVQAPPFNFDKEAERCNSPFMSDLRLFDLQRW